MNTQPPFEDAPTAAGTGTEQVTAPQPAEDSLTAPASGGISYDAPPAFDPPVTDAVAEAEADADLDDLLPGANPVPAGEAVFVVETDYMPDELPPETGPALAAAVDAAEAVAEAEADAETDAAPEEPAPAPADAPLEDAGSFQSVYAAVTEAEEAAELDDLLPGANPVPPADFAGAPEVAPVPEALPEETGAAFIAVVDAAEAVVAAEAEEILASASDAGDGVAVEVAPVAPVIEPVAPVVDVIEPVADVVAEAEDDGDLDDLLPGAQPVPAEVAAEPGAVDMDYMPADLPAETGAALVAAVDAAEAAAEAAADESGEDADSLDDFLPEVDPLMVAMVAEDAAEHATTEAEAVAVLDAVSGAVGGVIAEAEHTRQRLGAASPAELWLKMWARSVDFWIAGAKRKD